MSDESSKSRKLYRAFEGGAVYTAEENGEFLVVTNESAVAGCLSEEELSDMDLERVRRFSSEYERQEYLDKRFGPAKKPN